MGLWFHVVSPHSHSPQTIAQRSQTIILAYDKILVTWSALYSRKSGTVLVHWDYWAM